MPIYEYQCESCNAVNEILMLSSGEERSMACHRCGSVRLRKLISFTTKGSSKTQEAASRFAALNKMNPANPQQVATYFKERGSRFGDQDFRGTKTWRDSVDRVARGGPTLEE